MSKASPALRKDVEGQAQISARADAQDLHERLKSEFQPRGSEPKSRTSKRLLKAAVGIVAVAVFGYIPLRALLQASSVEAIINSRLVTLRSPIDGKVSFGPGTRPESLVAGTSILKVTNTRAERTRLDDLRRQLARYMNERPSIQKRLETARAAQADLKRLSDQFREGRIRQLNARVAEFETAINVAVARKEEATAALERASALVRSGTVSSVEAARLTREQLIAVQNEQGARHRLEATQIELAAAQSGQFLGDSYNDRPSSAQREEEMQIRVSTYESELSQVESEISWLNNEIAAEEYRYNNQFEATVQSPVAGRIWELVTADGEDVRAGQPLARILDCSSVVVTANVTESVYNKLQIGGQATFRPADGSSDVGGVIVNLTGSSGAAANLAISPDTLGKEAYRVAVTLPAAASADVKDCKIGRTGRVIFNRSAQAAR